MKKIILLIIISLQFMSCSEQKKEKLTNMVSFSTNEAEHKVDVLIDNQLFTSYIYNNLLPVLKKPVLFLIIADNGATITRGFPLDPKQGERVDHPHHIGAWFNYGDVNGLDFWNNSDAISDKQKNSMGIIIHDKIISFTEGIGKGKLSVSVKWIKPDRNILLNEKTDYIFYAEEGKRIIERNVTLSAENEPVLFKDNKEGMIAIRVARQLEHPSEEPVLLSDSQGNKTGVPVLDNNGISGHYLNSEGVEGTDVWAKRAKWVSLDGTINGKDVTVAILDNPENVGFPTYWHARGYGLFAANPLGQKVFSEGKDILNFNLNVGESVTFRYRILILNGKIDKNNIEDEYKIFINKN